MTPQQYQNLYANMQVQPSKVAQVKLIAERIRKGQPQYQSVMAATGVPWYVVGVIHMMECSLRFDRHLHNGDPLTARTTHVPAGRPLVGEPPFTWADSAIDALKLRRMDKVANWDIPTILLQLEGYNGLGYQHHGINTPYLWSFTNQYTAGKFIADGHFDERTVSGQCGAAPLLRELLS